MDPPLADSSSQLHLDLLAPGPSCRRQSPAPGPAPSRVQVRASLAQASRLLLGSRLPLPQLRRSPQVSARPRRPANVPISLSCSFSGTVVPNDHRLSGLKQYEFILLQFRKSEVQSELYGAKIKVSAGLPWGESTSSPFPGLWAASSLARGPVLRLRSQQCSYLSPTLTLLPSLPRTLVVTLGPPRQSRITCPPQSP